jgi:predicted DNA binding CopG/RHH family protein
MILKSVSILVGSVKTKSRRRSSKSGRTTKASRHKTTRVTVDFPDNEHRKLKALASLEGVTMQEYIRTHVMDKVNTTVISDSKFKKLMGKILDENEDVLKRLADK